MINILVLRSYGDYVILLNEIKNSTIKEPIKLFISNHLFELHESLKPVFPRNVEYVFINFKISKGILGLFTNKHFFSIQSLKELITIKQFLKNYSDQEFYLEQSNKSTLLSFFTGRKYKNICSNNNVYHAYQDFFKSTHLDKCITRFSLSVNATVLIFTDSRKKNKVIDLNTLNNINHSLNKKNISYKIAKFATKKQQSLNSNHLYYSNFDELVALIQTADFIITSDSLPAHIAEYLNVPHWILYNRKINDNWITPSSLQNNTYSTFSQVELLNNILV